MSQAAKYEGVDEPDDVEGLDDARGEGWGDDYPLDAVFVRTELRTVSEVVKRIEAKRYVLDPDFQRDFVWSAQKQSKLIESCVMRIPLPVLYVAEAPDGRIVVVDGLQRLTTFARFVSNELKLTGLRKNADDFGDHPLEGKYFDGLTLKLQERVQDTQLTMYILDAKAPERARLDIFERVNSGETLTRQQMRNALYNGPATVWLKKAAESSEFRLATGSTLNSKTMRDREAINRFCAFSLLTPAAYTNGDMDAFLGQALRKMTTLGDTGRDELAARFRASMLLNRSIFGEHAFRKSLASVQPHPARSAINISLFEVCAVVFSRLHGAEEHSAQAEIGRRLTGLIREESFAKAITYSTNSTAAVRSRFAAVEDAVREWLP